MGLWGRRGWNGEGLRGGEVEGGGGEIENEILRQYYSFGRHASGALFSFEGRRGASLSYIIPQRSSPKTRRPQDSEIRRIKDGLLSFVRLRDAALFNEIFNMIKGGSALQKFVQQNHMNLKIYIMTPTMIPIAVASLLSLRCDVDYNYLEGPFTADYMMEK